MMTPNAMADYIIGQVQGKTDASSAISAFYSALCSYCEANMQIQYSWVAFTPPPASTPDPMVLLDCKVKTAGSLSPSGATTTEAALAQFSADLNAQASTWQVVWPAGFAISPAFILPTINIGKSMADNMNNAWLSVCTDIINGLKAATPVGAGVHGGFTVGGTASFIQIL